MEEHKSASVTVQRWREGSTQLGLIIISIAVAAAPGLLELRHGRIVSQRVFNSNG